MATQRRMTVGFALGSMFLVFLACDNGPTEPERAVGFQTVLKTVLPGDLTQQPNREVIRDRAAWQAMWTGLYGGNPPSLPQVDFDSEMVVLAVGPGCCGDVEILSIDQRGGELVVKALSQASPNTLCLLADFSVHVVRLPRFEVPVRFEVRTGERLC